MINKNSWVQRAIVEAPIIVGSILLAFAIDAGWDLRLEDIERNEVLEGLQEEYEEHLETYLGHLKLAEERLADVSLLLQSAKADSAGMDSVEHALFQLLTVNTVDPGQGVRDGLISSGKLELLDTIELRLRLAKWEGVVDELRDKQNVMRQLVANQVVPYLSKRGVPLAHILSVSGQRHPQWPESLVWPDVSIATEVRQEIYQRILEDSEFQSYVSVRYLWLAWTSTQLRSVLAEIEWMLDRIQQETGAKN